MADVDIKANAKGFAGILAALRGTDKALDKTARAAGQARDEMGRFSKATDRLGAKLRKNGKALAGFGKKLTRNVTLPILATGVAAVKMASDFEDSLSKITGLVGVASDQVKEWRKDILALAPAVGKGPKELADAMFFVTSAGLRGQDALDALTASAQASAAGLGDTKNVADAITSAMNAYGAANLSAADATGILVAAVREGKASAESLSPVLGRVLPVASEMGVRFDEVAAAIAAMTRVGFSAEEASTSLRATLTSLLKPAKEAEQAFAKFGLSAAGLREKIKEDGLLSVLQLLKERVGDDQAAMAQLVPNVRALAGVLSLVGKNADEAQAVFESLAGASRDDLAAAFAEAAGTSTFKFNQALAQLKVTMIEVGAILIPIAVKIADHFRAIAEKFSELSPEMKSLTATVLGIVAALGPLAVIVGTLAVGAAGFPAFVVGLKAVGVALAPVALAVAALAIKIALIVGAVAAVAAAFFLMTRLLVRTAEKFDAFGDIVKTTFDNLSTTAKLMFAVISGDAKGALKIMTTEVISGTEAQEQAWESLRENVGDIWDGAAQDGKDALALLVQSGKDAATELQSSLSAGIALGTGGFAAPGAPAAGGGAGPTGPAPLASLGAVSRAPGPLADVSTETAPILTEQAIAAERIAAAIALVGEAGETTQAALATLDPGTAAFAEGQQQMQFLADKMGELDPESAEAFQAVADNARIEMARAGNAATSTIEQMSVGLSDWAEESAITIQTWGELAAETFDQFKQGVGDAVAAAIVEGENLASAMQSVLKTVIKSVISTLVQLAIQQLANLAISLIVNAGTGASGVAVAAAQTWANTFASISAIPIFGPALAPEAATAAVTAMLAGVSAASASGAAAGGAAAGGAAGGLEDVPETGTFVLHKNERVLSRSQNRSLMSMLDTALLGGGSQGDVIVPVQIAGPVVFDDFDLGDFDRQVSSAVNRERKRRRR